MYDINGNQLWTASYAGTALAVADNTNIIVTGFGNNFNTVKLNPAGSNVWTITYVDFEGPTFSQVVLVDGNGNVYLSGNDNFFTKYSLHDYRLTTVKYDKNGHQLWSAYQVTGEEGSVYVAGAALDNMGNVYVEWNSYGAVYETTRFSGNDGSVIWRADDPTGNFGSLANGLALDSSNNVFVSWKNAHYNPSTAYGTYKINTNGAYVWTNNYPSIPSTVSVGTAIAVGPDNNVYVTGYSPGTNSGNDIVTIKYDNNGNQIWLQRYNGPGNGDDEGNAIAVDANGNVYVTGYETTAAGGTEMVVS
jgi:outer membrane protein assembly factor BamB